MVELICSGCGAKLGTLPSGVLPNGTVILEGYPAHVAKCQHCAPDDVKNAEGEIELVVTEIAEQESRKVD